MDQSTEDSLGLLSLKFPFVDKESLLEILLACGGSAREAETLISQSFPTPPQKKRRIETIKRQSSIHSIIKNLENIKSHVNHAGKGKSVRLYTEEDVNRSLGPFVSLHKSIFPHEFADKLLHYFNTEGVTHLKNNKFFLFDKLREANHLLGTFCKSSNDEKIYYNGVLSNSKEYGELLLKAAEMVENFVNNEILANQKTPLKYQFTSKGSWSANRCVVNYYETGSNNLDWHSDRLNHIGPHCLIVSISLGATREFRLRRNYNNFDSDKPLTTLPIFSIVAPHNSLVIMHPGCQEEYRHCVAATAQPLEVNKISGSGRFNLTFRHFPPSFTKNAPKCRCGITMMLRRSFKEVASRGKYFWTCEKGYANQSCGEYHWANFKDPRNNFISKDGRNVSKWIAADDFAKADFNMERSLIELSDNELSEDEEELRVLLQEQPEKNEENTKFGKT